MSTTRTLSNLLRDANSPYCGLIERSRFHRDLQLRLESILVSDMAGRYRIQNLREGILILQTDSSSWAARLRFELPKLLERLRATQGLQQLREVQVRVTPPDHPRSNTSRRALLSREASAILESAAASIQDPQLRDAFRRLARKGNS